jgi:hypothetical protein
VNVNSNRDVLLFWKLGQFQCLNRTLQVYLSSLIYWHIFVGIDFGTRCLFHLMDLTDFASLIGVVVGASVIFCVGSFTNLA